MVSSQITVRVDHDADAAYIRLSDEPVRRTVEVTPEVMVDLDEMNVAVGVEVLRLEAEIPYSQLTTDFHVRSEVVETLRRIRPSVSSFLVSRVMCLL